MKYIIERKGGWYVTSYSKDKENEQNISSSRALSRALRFSEKEDAKTALADYVLNTENDTIEPAYVDIIRFEVEK